MAIGSLSDSDKAKIRELINQGVNIMGDMETLKEGLKETVDAVAQELEIKRNVLTKAIRVAHKMNKNRDELAEGREELDDVEELLLIAKKR